jgi:hypothetical protein
VTLTLNIDMSFINLDTLPMTQWRVGYASEIYVIIHENSTVHTFLGVIKYLENQKLYTTYLLNKVRLKIVSFF